MSTKFEVPHCMQCLYTDAEYFCKTCKLDLCTCCKEYHVIDLNTKEHDIVIDRLKYGDFIVPESCKKHAEKFYSNWCDQCNTPFCKSCDEHRRHESYDIVKVYDKKWRVHGGIIANIRSKFLLNSCAVLRGIKSDIEQCNKLKTQYQLLMTNKALNIKRFTDGLLMEMPELRKFKKYMKAKLDTETEVMKRHINTLQYLVNNSEAGVVAPFQFLLDFKKAHLSERINIPNKCSKLPILSLSKGINKGLLVSFLTEIDFSKNQERNVRPVRQEHVLKQLPLVLLKSVGQSVIDRTYHITCDAPKTFWISDYLKHLVLLDEEGKPHHQINDMKTYGDGVHTITCFRELIYVDKYDNICLLSTSPWNDNYILVKNMEEWEPLCIYFSCLTEELLVGMGSRETQTAEVHRYTYSQCEKVQTIKDTNNNQPLYKRPIYITENCNGDVVVSDYSQGAVVVTDGGGKHRFSYKGPGPEHRFKPRGLCKDPLSNILICDEFTGSIQMINKDGKFLLNLLTKSEMIFRPRSLAMDDKYRLFVGSVGNNTVNIYRYLNTRECFEHQSKTSNSNEKVI